MIIPELSALLILLFLLLLLWMPLLLPLLLLLILLRMLQHLLPVKSAKHVRNPTGEASTSGFLDQQA
jgi:hypothetical protein